MAGLAHTTRRANDLASTQPAGPSWRLPGRRWRHQRADRRRRRGLPLAGGLRGLQRAAVGRRVEQRRRRRLSQLRRQHPARGGRGRLGAARGAAAKDPVTGAHRGGGPFGGDSGAGGSAGVRAAGGGGSSGGGAPAGGPTGARRRLHRPGRPRRHSAARVRTPVPSGAQPAPLTGRPCRTHRAASTRPRSTSLGRSRVGSTRPAGCPPAPAGAARRPRCPTRPALRGAAPPGRPALQGGRASRTSGRLVARRKRRAGTSRSAAEARLRALGG